MADIDAAEIHRLRALTSQPCEKSDGPCCACWSCGWSEALDKASLPALLDALEDAQHWRERHCHDAAAYGEQSQKNWQSAVAAERERDELRARVDAGSAVLSAAGDALAQRLDETEARLAEVTAAVEVARTTLEGTAGVACYATIRARLRCFPRDRCSSCRAREALAKLPARSR